MKKYPTPAQSGGGREARRGGRGLVSCEILSWRFLERRLRLAQSRLLQMKRDSILHRLLHVWSTDTPGRWLEAMSLMPQKIRIRSHGHLAEVARQIAEMGTTPVGEITGNPCYDMWGRGRGMVGLLRFYDLTGSKEALEAHKSLRRPRRPGHSLLELV